MNSSSTPIYIKQTTNYIYEKEQIESLYNIFKLDTSRYSYSLTSIKGDSSKLIITLFYKGLIHVQIKYNNSKKCNIIRWFMNDHILFNSIQLDEILQACTNIYNYIYE